MQLVSPCATVASYKERMGLLMRGARGVDMGSPVSVVQMLGPDCYKTYLEPIRGGRDAITHKALVAFHDSGPEDTFVKVYCRNRAPKALVNEVAGYVIAKADGLAVSQRAAVLFLTPDQAGFLSPEVNPIRSRDGLVVAWCVQSIGGPTPAQAFNLTPGETDGLTRLQDDFAKWPELPKAVSLDAWLLNEDRNTGNLIRLASGRYALIDHGQICTGNRWSAPLDRSKMKHVNKLAWAAWGEPDIDNAPSKQRPAILAACDRHGDTLTEITTDLEHWLSMLLGEPEKRDAEGFFSDRTTTVGTYLRSAYGVLI